MIELKLSEYSSYESDFESEEDEEEDYSNEYQDDFENNGNENLDTDPDHPALSPILNNNPNKNGYFDDNHLYINDVVKKSGCETFVINFDDSEAQDLTSKGQNVAKNRPKRPNTTRLKVRPSKKEANSDNSQKQGVNTNFVNKNKKAVLLQEPKGPLSKRRPLTASEAAGKNQRGGQTKSKKAGKGGRIQTLYQNEL